MYPYEIVSQCVQSLALIWSLVSPRRSSLQRPGNLIPGVLMNARLAPDMGNFVYQVQSACDYVKAAAAWLSGQTASQA